MSANPLLSIVNVDAHYRDFQALFGVTLEVGEGEVVSLIGANAAGKSTLLKTVASTVPASRGIIRFRGEDIQCLPPHEVVAKGISLVPEGRHIFASLTVHENLLIGAYTGRSRPKMARTLERVYSLFPILKDRSAHMGTALSGGEQQMLAIGRSLMSNPGLMLLDEISHGLAPLVVKSIYRTVEEITRTGTAALLAEQDVGRSLKAAHRVFALVKGRALPLGEPSLLSEYDLKSAYFGS